MRSGPGSITRRRHERDAPVVSPWRRSDFPVATRGGVPAAYRATTRAAHLARGALDGEVACAAQDLEEHDDGQDWCGPQDRETDQSQDGNHGETDRQPERPERPARDEQLSEQGQYVHREVDVGEQACARLPVWESSADDGGLLEVEERRRDREEKHEEGDAEQIRRAGNLTDAFEHAAAEHVARTRRWRRGRPLADGRARVLTARPAREGRRRAGAGSSR
jgi:hypothetical protein